MTSRVLVGGFDGPGEGLSLTWRIAQTLDHRSLSFGAEGTATRRSAAVRAVRMPTVVEEARRVVLGAVELFAPDAVVVLGVAAHGTSWRVELLARNRDRRPSAAAPDAAERRGAEGPETYAPIRSGAPRILPTGLAPHRILGSLLESGLPAELSEDAGSGPCNRLFFELLLAAEDGLVPPSVGLVQMPPAGHHRSFALRAPRGASPDPPASAFEELLQEGARLVVEAVAGFPLVR